MSEDTLKDYNRRSINFNRTQVIEVVPEYFKEDHEKLIALLEAYGQYMDSDGGINENFRDLVKARDVGSVSLKLLDFILEETGLGINHEKFVDPRVITRNFPSFFKYKGSLFSAKTFFRALYGEEVEISYPKDQLFIVGESQLGPESLRYIQNGALYQVLSILIKSSQPISSWRKLYKKYVHPAGFYLGGEVLAEGVVDLSLGVMPNVIPDDGAGTVVFSGEASLNISGVSDPMTLILSSPDSDTQYRISQNKPISDYSESTISDMDARYANIFAIDDANTPTFDDSATKWSNDIETFDQSAFDSA